LVNSSFKKLGNKEIFSPELFVKSVNESLNGKGRLISNAIYTDAEKETLKEFSKQLAKTLTPKTLINNSKTASTIVDLAGLATIRSGAGVLAYNVGGIQTMLFARFGIDNFAKGSADRAARKILMDAIDINAIPSVTGFQGIINYGIENRPFIQKEKEYESSKEIFNLLNNHLEQTSIRVKVLYGY
jgi:hypothetical protein